MSFRLQEKYRIEARLAILCIKDISLKFTRNKTSTMNKMILKWITKPLKISIGNKL